jgi:hypothetical protein
MAENALFAARLSIFSGWLRSGIGFAKLKFHEMSARFQEPLLIFRINPRGGNMQNKIDDKRHNATGGSMENHSNEKKNDSSKHDAQQSRSHEHKDSDKPFRKDSDQDRGSSKPDDRGQHQQGGHSGHGHPHK